MSALVLATEGGTSSASTYQFDMPFWGWVLFLAGITALLLVDLLIIHRHAHVVGAKEAGIWSAIWIGLGLLFAFVVALLYGESAAAIDYLSGFLIEKSLSVDNLFVFVLIFQYFSVPAKYQHRVLFWGILGAFVFRGIFIALGAVLLARFSWIAYVFGAFLVYTAYRLATTEDIEIHPENNPVLKTFRRVGRITSDYRGQNMVVRENGKLWATPLMAVLIVVETTDILFAVDSIPAIFGVTRDPFLVFSSNAFALLGLRALFFLLADAVRRFTYLDQGVALILGLVGIKLMVEEAGLVHLPPWVSLAAIFLILGVAIWISIRRAGADMIPEEAAPTEQALEETPGDQTPGVDAGPDADPGDGPAEGREAERSPMAGE